MKRMSRVHGEIDGAENRSKVRSSSPGGHRHIRILRRRRVDFLRPARFAHGVRRYARAEPTNCEYFPGVAGYSAGGTQEFWNVVSIGPQFGRHDGCLRSGVPQRKEALMIAEQSTVHDWMRLIQAEYLEMPGLHLTKAQVQRLWRLEPPMCETLLDVLVAAEFLRKTHREAYVLAGGVSRSN